MPDENVSDYIDAPVNVLHAALNSQSISLSSKTRSALEVLLARKLKSEKVIKDANHPQIDSPGNNHVRTYNPYPVKENKSDEKFEDRFAVKPRKNKIIEISDEEFEEDFFEEIQDPDFENFKPYVIEIRERKYYLVKDLYKKFPIINAKSHERIIEDFAREKEALLHDKCAYVGERLYERIKNSITDSTAAHRLQVYPSAIDVLINKGKIEPLTSGIHYLVMRESVERLGTLSYSEREKLNSKAIEYALVNNGSELIDSDLELESLNEEIISSGIDFDHDNF